MNAIIENYRTLTNIDIAEQRRLWDERGKGYYGEYLVFSTLFSNQNIPGLYKILMNIQIPSTNGKSTEIDLLLIHETGLYVFEIKHYKGTIYGKIDDQRWTQFFRTESNKTFLNPIAQNQYHIDSLRMKYAQLPIHSFIVFTNSDCDLRVTGAAPNLTVCPILRLVWELRAAISHKTPIMGMEQMESVFQQLKEYSPMTSSSVVVSGQEIMFQDYLNSIIREQQNALWQNYANYQQQMAVKNKEVEKIKWALVIVGALLLMGVVGFAMLLLIML